MKKERRLMSDLDLIGTGGKKDICKEKEEEGNERQSAEPMLEGKPSMMDFIWPFIILSLYVFHATSVRNAALTLANQ